MIDLCHVQAIRGATEDAEGSSRNQGAKIICLLNRPIPPSTPRSSIFDHADNWLTCILGVHAFDFNAKGGRCNASVVDSLSDIANWPRTS